MRNDQQPIKLQNSQILNDLGTKLSHLPSVKRKKLAEVINQYREIFPNVPIKTYLIEHDVDVGDSAPIKQHPYRVSLVKKELLEKEVQYMLKNDIIEESQSNWSSEYILVPKHDSKFRFCTDFRKVNDNDSFPIPRIADCIDQICCIVFLTLLQLKSISTMNSTFDPVPHGYVMWVYYIKINIMQPLFCKICGLKYICIIVVLTFDLEAHFVPQD